MFHLVALAVGIGSGDGLVTSDVAGRTKSSSYEGHGDTVRGAPREDFSNEAEGMIN